MSRLRGANAVLIVTLPEGFVPRSAWDIPPMFSQGELYARRIPLYMAQGFAWTFNKHQMQERLPGRKWAIPCNAKLDVSWLSQYALEERQALLLPVFDGQYNAKAGAVDSDSDNTDPAVDAEGGGA